MNGKIRVSIVATSLKGSNINVDTKPILNIVNNSGNNNSYSDNLFSKNNAEHNIVNSIDGATALKLDENYEIIVDTVEKIRKSYFLKKKNLTNNEIHNIIYVPFLSGWWNR